MTTWELAFAETLDSARDLAAHDPEILRDFETFLNVMWSEDYDMERFQMEHDEYRDFLRQVFNETREHIAH